MNIYANHIRERERTKKNEQEEKYFTDFEVVTAIPIFTIQFKNVEFKSTMQTPEVKLQKKKKINAAHNTNPKKKKIAREKLFLYNENPQNINWLKIITQTGKLVQFSLMNVK